MSTPAHAPRTRAATTPCPTSLSRPSVRRLPIWRARSWNSPELSSSTTWRPMAAASGLPPNVEPWGSGRDHTENVLVCCHGRDRVESAAESLAEHVDVWHHVLVVTCERTAGARETGLDLVGDHQHVLLGAQVAELAQEAVRRKHDSAFPLDGLEENRDHRRIHGSAQLVRVSRPSCSRASSRWLLIPADVCAGHDHMRLRPSESRKTLAEGGCATQRMILRAGAQTAGVAGSAGRRGGRAGQSDTGSCSRPPLDPRERVSAHLACCLDAEL